MRTVTFRGTEKVPCLEDSLPWARVTVMLGSVVTETEAVPKVPLVVSVAVTE